MAGLIRLEQPKPSPAAPESVQNKRVVDQARAKNPG